MTQDHASEAPIVYGMHSFQAQGHDLFGFYEKLRKEQEERNYILLLVTRKGFWMYYLLLGDRIKEKFVPDREVVTDRFLMKTLERNMFGDRAICLVDDTLSNGYSLFRYYCILKREGVKSISPWVYALSTEFPRDSLQVEMKRIYREIFPGEDDENAEKAYGEFASSLRCYRYMSQGKISRFCLREVEFFQEKLCPMVVNLPMMVGISDGGKITRDNFLLDAARFARLTEGDANWRYFQNVYGCGNQDAAPYRVAGYLSCDIQCNYFEYTDSVVEDLRQSILQSMVVKCKYNIDDEGYYHIVFTPFAIVRSLEKTELKEMFRCLLQGTEYGDRLVDGLENSESEFLWTAAMRSVVYVLSLYAGERFREYLGKFGIAEAGYDFDIMKYNSDPQFIRDVQKIDTVQRVSELCDKHILANRKNSLSCKPGIPPMMTEIYEVIHLNIAISSEENHKDNNDNDADLDIEGIEKVLTERFAFNSEEELSNAVTSIILLMLEISVFGNYIRIRDKQVWRGFRHGENTKILLPKSGRLCYVCAEALFITLKEQGYRDYLSEFLESMKEYMQETGFFTESCDRENFNQYCNWFLKTRNDARFQILGKECLLDKLDEDEKKLHSYAIYRAEEYEMRREESKSGND